ncbi:MAG: hypothetical protein LBR56_07800 [Sporomusaceae bacterium]|jgi:hypothetical protein|nr:hypothetical protein [Sporomusaceae bacterium]
MQKEKCRPPTNSGGKKLQEELSFNEIRRLMSRASYERSASGAIRSKRTAAVFK